LSSQIEGQILNETVSGIRFNDTVVASCINFKGDYLSDEECANYAGIGYVLQYNFTAIHATPLYQTLADEAIVREALNDDDFKIKTVIHPLPQTGFEANLSQAGDAFTAWFLIILSFPFILGSFATFVVAERESKAKHLQTVAGVKPSSYWLSTWLWDVANYQIPMGITIILMFAFGVDVMTTTDRGVLGGVIILFVLFGPAGASFTYCVSFLFSSPSICNLFIIISGFLIGLGGTMASFIMTLIGNDPGNPNDKLVTAANIINWVLRFIPAFNLSRGLFAAINIETLEFLAAEPITVWHDSVMLYEVIFLMWQSVVYLLLAMKIDEWSSNPRAVNIWHGFTSFITCQWICGSSYHIDEDEGIKAPEDDDVLAEQERVHTGGANDDLIVLDKLRKVYDNGKVAVNNMSLGIPPGQCFGLLGINGAGKFEFGRVCPYPFLACI
jgi:ABC-type multidrug transport system fused ATPase/permease subunit